jgi:hypothetical protein
MKNLKLILKGMLFYSSLLLTTMLLMGIESIIEQDCYGLLFCWILLLISLWVICKKIISEKELYILTFSKYF